MTQAAPAPAGTVGLVDTSISPRYKDSQQRTFEVLYGAGKENSPSLVRPRKKPRAIFGTRLRRRLARKRRRARARGASPSELASLSRPRRETARPAANVNVIAEIYPVDVRLKIRGLKAPTPRALEKRGAITRFSLNSRRRFQFFTRNTRDLWHTALTLTYPGQYPRDGREVKRHINAFCQWLRRQKIAYVWILEFQRRGAPHFHFMLTADFLAWRDVREAWHAIAGAGDPRHLVAGTRIQGLKDADHAAAYLAEYGAKLEQKIVPDEYRNVGRFWGASRVLRKTLYRMDCLYAEAARALRQARLFQACNARASWGFKWRWKGHGFILRDGSGWFRNILRQAVRLDCGADLWREYAGDLPPPTKTERAAAAEKCAAKKLLEVLRERLDYLECQAQPQYIEQNRLFGNAERVATERAWGPRGGAHERH